MIPEEKVKRFKQYLEDTFVVAPTLLDWELDQQGRESYIEATRDLGFIDFLYNNVFKLTLDDDKLEKYIDIINTIANLNKDLKEIIGSDDDNLKMLQLLAFKIENWSELNQDAVNNFMVNYLLEQEV
jgi:hypothetical protein